MKNLVFIIVFVIYSCNCMSQSLEKLKNRDTIYISADKEKVFDDLRLVIEIGKNNDTYNFIFPDAKQLMFDTYLKTKELTYIKKKSSSFNSNIVTIDDIHNLGYTKTLNLLYNKKLVIYIFNIKDINKRRICLKRVYLQYIPNTEI